MRRMAFPLGQGEMTARDFLAEITTNCVKMKAQDRLPSKRKIILERANDGVWRVGSVATMFTLLVFL